MFLIQGRVTRREDIRSGDIIVFDHVKRRFAILRLGGSGSANDVFLSWTHYNQDTWHPMEYILTEDQFKQYVEGVACMFNMRCEKRDGLSWWAYQLLSHQQPPA